MTGPRVWQCSVWRGLAITVGLADSLNLSTIGPALVLATAQRPVARVAQFTVGVYAVNLLAGLVLTIAPGRLLVALVPHPQGTVRHAIELAAGVILLAAALAIWLRRHSLARRELPGHHASGGSALVLGVTMAAVELPTAVPYLAVIAAIAAADVTVPQQVALLGMYNLAFVAPLLVIVAALLIPGAGAQKWLDRRASWLRHIWPVALTVILLIAGAALSIIGGVGLVR